MQSGITKSILLVDDDKDILSFLTYNLRKEGYKVFTATNGEEAIAQVKKIQPSLILLDVMMPILDGIETCRLIRSLRLNEEPIIAMLTARSEEYSEIAPSKAPIPQLIWAPSKAGPAAVAQHHILSGVNRAISPFVPISINK